MKLVSIELLEKFRGLPGGFKHQFIPEVALDFNTGEANEDFAPFVLTGRNGSGKSNLLELLAAIFYQLDCQYLDFLPDVFRYNEEQEEVLDDKGDFLTGLKPEFITPIAFKLFYQIATPLELQEEGTKKFAYVCVHKAESAQTAKLYWLNHPRIDALESLPRAQAKALLPERVVAYSSGENQVLSLPFFKMRYVQFDHYMQSLYQDSRFDERIERRLTYLDNEFSQAIVLANLLMNSSDEDIRQQTITDDSILKPFRDNIRIFGLLQFRLILKRSIMLSADKATKYQREYLNNINDDRTRYYKLSILAKMQRAVDRLTRCATTWFLDEQADEIYLDFKVTAATYQAFQKHYANALDLFEDLEYLLKLNLHNTSDELKNDLYQSQSLYVTETVPVSASDKRVVRFKDLVFKTNKKDGKNKGELYLRNLSDGEHQFLHSLGLCLLYRNKNALFLLDEPETHFNPDWRAQFIASLKSCFALTDKQTDEVVQRDMLITTHSPFLISDSEEHKVLEFTRENDEISVTHPDYTTLGASVNKITLKSFKLKSTIGGVAAEKLRGFREELAEKTNDSERHELLDRVNKVLGESVEKLLFINDILDKMEQDKEDSE